MKLRIEQLTQYLGRNTDTVFFLSGDEPLQMMEAADLIRKHALQQGYDERDILLVGCFYGVYVKAVALLPLRDIIRYVCF